MASIVAARKLKELVEKPEIVMAPGASDALTTGAISQRPDLSRRRVRGRK